MKFISTRGEASAVGFVDACLAGLAPDGGLYVPEEWPSIAPATTEESYVDVATRVIAAFADGELSLEVIRGICARAYERFSHQSVAPLVQTGPNAFMMELHHGPTLAFKDVAMQMIAQLFDHVLAERGERMSVTCATSGDTGGAAAAAFSGAGHVDLFILHPFERISPVQRLFMTTTGAPNVHNLALTDDFDACQAIVKALFADRDYVRQTSLSGVNSINWARIAAQSVYYATAQAALGSDRPLRFVVPSGNMGDALAGYVAARCGMLSGFEGVCAVNENDTLNVLFEQGRMRREQAVATPSPAMDISVPSNFERIAFEVSGRDASLIRQVYNQFAQTGDVDLPSQIKGPLRCSGLSSQSISNDTTMTEMATVLGETGWLICPHTAVGTAVARSLPPSESTTVVLSTAHAAKFPETVEQATGRDAPFPDRVKALAGRTEVFEKMAADPGAVREYILTHQRT
ncbi:threonine synthase [Henriciella pelagia]|jgi:threonine synthase|uniref:Threonine synthase n=1 Tax=Henriciella pelagia TaxID=1977912 RepID=A0ABQ1J5Z9_9PROT|nr:threonine synthase [Henriciella pelagia]GGB60460.1 threonine synthase [Henriciella pelagia]